MREKSPAAKRQYRNLEKPDRLMQVLFNDKQWVADNVKADRLMSQLFEIATNMQSHDTDTDLYPLFNENEIYDQWRTRNIRWYIDYGPAPQTGGAMPFAQETCCATSSRRLTPSARHKPRCASATRCASCRWRVCWSSTPAVPASAT